MRVVVKKAGRNAEQTQAVAEAGRQSDRPTGECGQAGWQAGAV